MEKLMTFKEVCSFVGISAATMKHWLSKGQGPKVLWTPNGRRRFREADVLVWHSSFFTETKPVSRNQCA
jgi:predicted site-specific integrase-resolvase